MPECYTHVHTALQALMRSGHTVASNPAFTAGANGPDPLFMFQVWRKYARPNMRGLAAKMHREKTGEFLRTLIACASTPVQQSYALGFVSHYISDCSLHPYIAAMSAPGMPYAGENGQYMMETAMDSRLYYDDYKTRMVPLHSGTPVLLTNELAEVCTLLREAIYLVYEMDIPLLVLADTFHDNLAVRRHLFSKTGFKRLLIRIIQPRRPAKYGPPLSCRMQPGKPLRRLPEKWVNPYTQQAMDLNFKEVIALSIDSGAICITATVRYWLGELGEEKLANVLGNNDYYTGLPCQQPQESPGAAGQSVGQLA